MPVLGDEYRQTLRNWLGRAAVPLVLLVALGLWYSVVNGEPQVLFLAIYAAVVATVGLFLLVTLYYVVLGYLSTKPAPRRSGSK